MMPLVSVVVPTFRRPQLLQRCLAALALQSLPRTRYEIIVADDEDSPATAAICASLCERWPDLRLVYKGVRGRHGPAAARNAGWQAARAALIAFTDDDCVVSTTWLAAGLEAMSRSGAQRAVCASGRLVMPIASPPTDYERNESRLATAGFVTANAFVRRAALIAVGGFDEDFREAWREDSDLLFRLVEVFGDEARLDRTIDDAAVVHPIRRAPWGVSLLQQRKAMYNALLYKKHPARYRRWIQALPPLRYYAATAAVAGTVVSAAAGEGIAAAACATAWLALTVDFARRRLAGTSRRASHVVEMAVTSAAIPLACVYWRLRGAVRYRVLFL